MKKSQVRPTTAQNLERKFDGGDDVLDYFDVRRARVIEPQSSVSVVKVKSSGAYSVNPNSGQRAVVREKSASYRKKK
jgi:hypothetical protein